MAIRGMAEMKIKGLVEREETRYLCTKILLFFIENLLEM